MKQIKTVADIGKLVRKARKQDKLTQTDLAGISGTGVRFIVDLENGKESIQMGKALHVLGIMGIKLAVLEMSNGE